MQTHQQLLRLDIEATTVLLEKDKQAQQESKDRLDELEVSQKWLEEEHARLFAELKEE